MDWGYWKRLDLLLIHIDGSDSFEERRKEYETIAKTSGFKAGTTRVLVLFLESALTSLDLNQFQEGFKAMKALGATRLYYKCTTKETCSLLDDAKRVGESLGLDILITNKMQDIMDKWDADDLKDAAK
jgi:hypothetical protein